MGSDLINGEVPAHWEFTTLGDVCRRGGGNIQTGPFGSQLHAADYVAVGVPSIMPTNIGDNRIVEDGIVRITEFDAERLAQHRVRPGDIVYSRRGDVEKRALIREREAGWLCGTGCLKVRLGKGVVDPLYASFFLGHPSIKEWIVRHAIGATMPNLNTSIMSSVPFVVPPIAEQRAIAHVLGTLDDKVELNRRMNETLEEMARALFKSWFVDFDPVRAKMEGRAPYGMDAATAALFPDSFEDSELGPIPKRWPTTSLDEHVILQRGTTYKSRLLGLTGPVLLGLGSIRPGGGFRDERLKTYGGDCPEKMVLTPGDMYVALKGATKDGSMVGSIARVPPTVVSGRLTQDTVKLEFRDPHARLERYVYWLLQTGKYRDYCAGRATGSAQVGFSRADFLSYQFALPPSALLARFAQIEESLSNRIDTARAESLTLTSTRDALLPKLFSGEIRSTDAERQVEAVA